MNMVDVDTKAALVLREVHTGWAPIVQAVAVHMGITIGEVARDLGAALSVDGDLTVHAFLALIGIDGVDALAGVR
jgi:hypothetical protein